MRDEKPLNYVPEKSARALDALKHYASRKGPGDAAEPVVAIFGDLLTDLYHLAAAEDIDFDRIAETSLINFESEVSGRLPVSPGDDSGHARAPFEIRPDPRAVGRPTRGTPPGRRRSSDEPGHRSRTLRTIPSVATRKTLYQSAHRRDRQE